MENHLAEILVDKNILTKGMEVEAKYNAKGLGGINNIAATGSFIIESIKKGEGNKMIFFLSSTRAGERKVLLADNIVNIEGQTPARFAASYDVMPDGGEKPKGKRRGRIPKHIKAAMAASLAQSREEDEDNDGDDEFLCDDAT